MWYWPVSIVVVAILFVWWALTRQANFTEPSVGEHGHHSHAAEHDHSAAEEHTHRAVSITPEEKPEQESVVEMDLGGTDDLEIIEGIGPKIASILNEAGIRKFSQLASLDAEKVSEILMAKDARIGRIANPGTWAEQSRLAAEGKLEALKTLQDNLKGGRKA